MLDVKLNRYTKAVNFYSIAINTTFKSRVISDTFKSALISHLRNWASPAFSLVKTLVTSDAY